MTKRLFAIVLAAILAITMFTFPVAAEGVTATLLNPDDGTRLALTFTSGAEAYSDCTKVVINYLMGNSVVKTVTLTSATDLKKTADDFATTRGGEYSAQVVYYDGSKLLGQATSGSVIVPITTPGTNMKVEYGKNGIKLEFTAQKNATAYTAVYTYKSGNSTVNGSPVQLNPTIDSNNKATCYFHVNISYSDLVSIKLYVGTPSSYSTNNFASWGNTSSSGNGSSVSGLDVQGNVTAQIINGSIVGTITDYQYAQYRVGIYYAGMSQPSYSYLNSKSFSYALSNLPSSNVQFYVEGTSNSSYGYWQQVGRIYYNYGSSGSSGTGNVSISYYNGNYVLNWPAISGVQYYTISYQGNGINSGSTTVNGNTTYWNIPFASYSNSFMLAVTAVMNDGSRREIGYTGTSYGNNNSMWGNGQTTGGVVTQGSNCTVTSYSNYAYIQWVSSGASDYVVMVYRDGDTSGLTYYVSGAQTYYQIPISNTYNYNVVVYNRYNSYAPVASATVKASATSTLDNIGVKKTEIKNLRVTELNSYTTSLSWDKVSGADCYVVTYGLLNGGIAEEIPVYNNSTSATIPFGSSTAYQATVYAVTSSGRSSEVGHVYNVPGTTASNSSSKDYPSNLTAKSSNKKISLSWKAADGASSYTIYYKRATSSSWNKINQKITKTAVNISGLTNNIDYDFKVVPNKGSESGIVTIAPSASTSKTVTAKDPSSSSSSDDDVNLDDEELTVTSVSSTTKGKIKITWSNVGAPSYKIYVAEGTSNSYKPCGTYTGTSATISTFGTGSSATTFTSGKTYKVRIVRTDYTGSIKDALKACPYKSVTVK